MTNLTFAFLRQILQGRPLDKGIPAERLLGLFAKHASLEGSKLVVDGHACLVQVGERLWVGVLSWGEVYLAKKPEFVFPRNGSQVKDRDLCKQIKAFVEHQQDLKLGLELDELDLD